VFIDTWHIVLKFVPFSVKFSKIFSYLVVIATLTIYFITSTSLRAEDACAQNSVSLACKAHQALESGHFCAGCMPLGDLMKIELRWDSRGDLDLHVWRPPSRTEARRRRVGWDNDEEGLSAWYSCDYQGNKAGRKGCVTKGERVNIARSAFVYSEDEDRTYCVAVQNYSRIEPGEFVLSLAPVGAAALTCTGTKPAATGPLNADERGVLEASKMFAADICGGTFPADVGSDIATLPWLSLLVFRAPVPTESVSLDELTLVRGLSCIDKRTGKAIDARAVDAE